MIVTSFANGFLPAGEWRTRAYGFSSVTCMRIITRAFSCVITYHNRHNMAKSDGICVANHTTPIDVFFLNCDRAYALVLGKSRAERKGGGLVSKWNPRPAAFETNRSPTNGD